MCVLLPDVKNVVIIKSHVVLVMFVKPVWFVILVLGIVADVTIIALHLGLVFVVMVLILCASYPAFLLV